MGNKYREDLKHLRLNKHLWALVPVDDTIIRKDSFKESKKLLHKMDRLERTIEHFYSTGQKLFNEWYDLTFRHSREQIEKKDEEYIALAMFHNSIVAASEMLDLEMWEAYQMIIEENRIYLTADKAERERIDILRKKRSEFAEQQTRDSFDFEDNERPSNDMPSKAEAQADLTKIKKMSDQDILKLLNNKDLGHPFILQVLKLCGPLDEMEFFDHVWSKADFKTKTDFKKYFYRNFGEHFEVVLEDFGITHDEAEPISHKKYVSAERPEVSKSKPFDFETLKMVYRKLVRILHPDRHFDLQSPETLWMKSVWHQVQKAYTDKDKKTLERLFLIVQIRASDLSNLSVSEIRQSAIWLKDDLQNLEKKTKALKKHPAWGFAIGRDPVKLEKKIALELQLQIHKMDKKINEIKSVHEQMERLANQSEFNFTRRRNRRPAKRRRAPSREQREFSF